MHFHKPACPHSLRVLLYGLMCACVLAGPTLVIAATKNPQPTWSVDLKKHGFRGPRLGLVNDPGSLPYMAFSEGTVAVLFDQKAEEIPQKGTDVKTWLGWRLLGLFFDASTGELLAKRTWVAYLPWPNSLLPTAGGNFVYLMTRFPRPMHIPTSPSEIQLIDGPLPTTLLLLSPTGDELKRLELRVDETSKQSQWQARISPSGKSLLMIHSENSSCQFLLLDADTLKQRATWDTASCPVVEAISDKQMLISKSGHQLVGKFGDSLTDIALSAFKLQFLTDDSIVAFGAAPWGDAWITDSAGKLISRFHFDVSDPGHGGIRPGVLPPFVSHDGRRFGTISDQIVGPILFRKGERTLYIWQEPGDSLAFTTQLRYSFSDGAQAALSSDGSRVVVLNSRKLSMYKLPAY